MPTTISKNIIAVIGGTGAQGVPVVKALSNSDRYSVRVLTRDAKSSRAQELASLPNVEIVEGQYTQESVVKKLFEGVYGCFVNTDGFSIGEREEIYWGMRIFEIAAGCGVKHYVWGNLDYSSKLGGFDPKFRCGHYDGKGRIAEWVVGQKNLSIIPTVLTSGPYLEMLQEGLFVPKQEGDGKIVYRQPLFPGGKIPMIALEDIGVYAVWIFDHPERAANLELQVASAHVDFADVVEAFNRIHGPAGKLTASHEPLTIQEFLAASGVPKDAPLGAVFLSTHAQVPGLTFWENFEGFWNLWNANVVRRDYTLLDEIHPDRIRSVEEWMRKTNYDGTPQKIFKNELLGSSVNSVMKYAWRKLTGAY